VETFARRLSRCGERSLEDAAQRHDFAAGRLKAALERNTAVHERDLVQTTVRFTPALLDRPRALKAQRLAELSDRLAKAAARVGERAEQHARLPALQQRLRLAVDRRLSQAGERLSALEQLRVSLNPDRPLDLGFARIHRESGHLARSAAELRTGEAVRLVFKDAERGAVVDGGRPAKPSKPRLIPVGQGDLF
jgi:exodeoxyribonuclease VII large subunit